MNDEAVRNLKFPSSVTTSGEAPLEDGSYEEGIGRGASPASVTLTDTARGDLDEDLVESRGGTGSFYGLWAILNEDGEPALSGESVAQGDRIQVRALAVGEDGVVALEATVGGPDDPLCCPTQGRRSATASTERSWPSSPDPEETARAHTRDADRSGPPLLRRVRRS